MRLVEAQGAQDDRVEAKRQIRQIEAQRQEQLMEQAIYDKFHRYYALNSRFRSCYLKKFGLKW